MRVLVVREWVGSEQWGRIGSRGGGYERWGWGSWRARVTGRGHRGRCEFGVEMEML
jgi:hypothetical protein